MEMLLNTQAERCRMEVYNEYLRKIPQLLTQLEGCIGVKTGYTKASGRTLVSCVERGGRRLVAVTLCDGNDWADHKALYEMGFAALEQENAKEGTTP